MSDNERPVEPTEQEAPRRGASAQFTVAASAGAEAAMRQAMDPANQSLAEALRLSYRVLQVAILALVVVFLFSGFQQVQEGQTGVKTFFGRIVGAPGDEQVAPGLQPFWPYPVGEIVLLPQKDAVELNSEFWPKFPQGANTVEEATNASSPEEPVRPGRDGSLITADGDLAHVRIAAEFTVDDAVRTLDEFRPDALRDVVRKALQRSMVQVAAQFTLQELLESRDLPVEALRERAQSTLDTMKTGVKLTSVTIPEKIAPLAIRNAFGRVQESRENAKLAIEKAQQEANSTLVGMAGPEWAGVLDLVQRYEAELTRGDMAAADAVMQELGARFEGGTNVGQTSAIISRAQAFRTSVRATLGKELGRLNGLAPAFRENPAQLVRKLWLDAVRQVLASRSAEVVTAPDAGGPVRLGLESSNEVMQARRQAEVDRRKMQSQMNMQIGPDRFQLGSKQIMIDAPGRRLDRNAEKGFGRD
jgi:regulator of protease activity HflC (stomatin/prohibitin superfamily)